ncbi:hypothetical protein, partial [Levilactobacillus koreensis]|uniref:hypothetical protein n=1 Tax=Levilactobacillus koreensis TaxID=637971 RepID=UPI001F329B0F
PTRLPSFSLTVVARAGMTGILELSTFRLQVNVSCGTFLAGCVTNRCRISLVRVGGHFSSEVVSWYD